VNYSKHCEIQLHVCPQEVAAQSLQVTFLPYVLRPTQPSPLSESGNELRLTQCALRGEDLVWRCYVCLLSAPPVQLIISVGTGWPQTALW